MKNDARKTTWELYTSTWSEAHADTRVKMLERSVHPDYAYTDPNVQARGHIQLSDYMAEFQKNVPGGKFVTTKFEQHHDRCLVHYDLVGVDESVLTTGASYGVFGADGRLVQMVGFQS
jgi:hypothetical protein